MSLKEILQTATYFFVILTRNAVCVRRETGLFGVVCNCSGTGYPVFATVYASNAALTYLMPREDDRVAIFRMDKDQFRRQIAELEQTGAEYEGAKASLSSAVGNSCQDLVGAQRAPAVQGAGAHLAVRGGQGNEAAFGAAEGDD